MINTFIDTVKTSVQKVRLSSNMVSVLSGVREQAFPAYLLNAVGHDLTAEQVDPSPEFATKLVALPTLSDSKAVPPRTLGAQRDPPTVVSAAFSGGHSLLGLSSGYLVRWSVDTGATTFISVNGLSTPNEEAEIRDVFLGPDGVHGLVRLSTGDVCYVSSTLDVATSLPSLKGYHIRCVCWDTRRCPKPATTHEILIGTANGTIYSAIISGGKDRIVRPVFSFPKRVSVEHIVVFEHSAEQHNQYRFQTASSRGTSAGDGASEEALRSKQCSMNGAVVEFSIIVATATRLYCFTGGPTLEHAFQGVSIPAAQYFKSDSVTQSVLEPSHEAPAARSPQHATPLPTIISNDASAASAVKYERSINDYVFIESPKESSMTQLLLSAAPHAKTVLDRGVVSDMLEKKKIRTAAVRYPEKTASHLLWWLTGAGVIIALVKPAWQATPPPTTLSSDSPEAKCQVSRNSVNQKQYKLVCPPVVLQPNLQNPSDRRKTRGKGGGNVGFLKPDSKGGERFRLRTEPSLDTRYFTTTDSSYYLPASATRTCLSVALSPYSVLLLYESRLVVLSRITLAKVQCLSLPAVRYGAVRRLISDSQNELVFLLTTRYIFHVTAHRERETVWLQYLTVNDFSSALQHLQSDHPAYQLVCCEYGKHLFREGQLSRGAEILTDCAAIPPEDLLLRFFSLSRKPGFLTTAVLTALMCQLRLRAETGPVLRSYGFNKGAAGLVQHWLSVLQLWLLAELVHNLNESEFKIERLKHERKARGHSAGRQETAEFSSAYNASEMQHSGETQCCVSPDGNWMHKKEVTQLLSSYITAEIKRRKTLLNSIHSLMRNLQHISLEVPIYALFERFGRPNEKCTWAALMCDQETQILEHINQGDFTAALVCLGSDPAKAPAAGSQCSKNVGATLQSFGARCQDNSYGLSAVDWRLKQLQLLAKYGPLLFLRSPVHFSALLLRPDMLGPSLSAGFSEFLDVHVRNQPSLLDFLHPILLPGASVPPSGSQYCITNYTELHRIEVLKILDRYSSFFLPRTIADQSSHFVTKDATLTLERLAPNLKTDLGDWTGINGIWNLIVTTLASCEDTETELIACISSLIKSSTELNTREKDGRTPDALFSLRICLERGQDRAVLLLLILVGMYQDAVRAALETGDLEMAKLAVQRVPLASEVHGVPLKRRLWRDIVQKAAEAMDTPSLIALLQESSGILRLHEHLEFLTNPSVIAAYRDVLCEEFDRCEQRVRDQQTAIRYNRQAIESLKSKLKSQRALRIAEVSSSKTLCLACQRPPETDRFYVFPCAHMLHAVCAHRLKYPTMHPSKREKYKRTVLELRDTVFLKEGKESQLENASFCTAQHDQNVSYNQLQNWKKREQEVDKYLNDECPLCGNWLTEIITQPFLSHQEIESIWPSSQLPSTTTAQRYDNNVFPSNEQLRHWVIADGPLPMQSPSSAAPRSL